MCSPEGSALAAKPTRMEDGDESHPVPKGWDVRSPIASAAKESTESCDIAVIAVVVLSCDWVAKEVTSLERNAVPEKPNELESCKASDG